MERRKEKKRKRGFRQVTRLESIPASRRAPFTDS